VLYNDLAQWLRDNTLPDETIAVQQTSLAKYLAERPMTPLPANADTATLLAALDQARPDYCIALNSLAWQGVRRQPWFQERYQQVYALASPYDAATPLVVFRYAPTPFDAGELVTATATFVVDESTGEQLELVGYRLDSQRITPGEALHLTLYWRTATWLHQSLASTVRLFDPATGQVLTQAENPAPGGLATALWPAGKQLDDGYTLLPPADVPPGEYVLDVALHLPNGRSLAVRTGDEGVTETGETRFVLARVHRPPSVSTAPPTPDHSFRATFGSEREIELVGYDVKTRILPGDTLRVALYWHVRQLVPLDYKVFVHLLASEGESIALAQDDDVPVGWTYPTAQWQSGETIRDEHVLDIPPSAPRGDYWLIVGMYDSATGERPVVRDAMGSEIVDRRVTLGQIRVR
jgi:hypothetical protein